MNELHEAIKANDGEVGEPLEESAKERVCGVGDGEKLLWDHGERPQVVVEFIKFESHKYILII